MKFLDERKKRIAKGLDDAERTRFAFEQAEQKKQEIIQAARIEANKIIADARNQGQKQKAQILQQAEVEAKEIKKQKIQEAKEEKEEMLVEARSSLSDVVKQSVKKILGNKMTLKLNKKYIESVLNKV